MAPDRISEDWITERLDSLWPAHLAGFARLLTVLRGQFEGDLDAMLILLAVSLGTEKEDWREALLGVPCRTLRTSTTNGLSIAEMTGIPRETVRRKLALLHDRGWIERDAAGNWTTTRCAAEDLRPSTMATLLYLRTLFGAALVADAGTPPTPPYRPRD